MVLADKADSSRAIREHLRKRRIRAVIPVPAGQQAPRLRRVSRDGRPPAFDPEIYKQRNTIERCINHLKLWARYCHWPREDRNHLPGWIAHRWRLPPGRIMISTSAPV